MSERLYTEGELAQWLETTAITPRPDYIDDLLARTARSRQRSAWRFPERWLPMDITARAPAISGRRVPVRMMAVVALLVLAVAAGDPVRRHRSAGCPPRSARRPTGSSSTPPRPIPSWVDNSDYQRPQGDIFTIDPVTGASSVLVGGPTVDGYPVVSLDGTRVAFVREAGSVSSSSSSTSPEAIRFR